MIRFSIQGAECQNLVEIVNSKIALLPEFVSTPYFSVRRIFLLFGHPALLVEHNIRDSAVAGKVDLQLPSDFLSFAPEK